MRLQGDEKGGKKMEDQGRQMKKMGLNSAEDDSFIDASTSGPDTSSHSIVARINVLDVVDREALETRRFNFAGKLLGERGIHLKKIEAIASCHIRYNGPWPGDQSKTEAYLQLTSTTEQV